MALKNSLSKHEKETLLDQTTMMGDRISQAMEDEGVSNRTLSVLMEVGERTVSDWKRDGTISLKRLPLLARHLNVTVEWLITGEESHTFQNVNDDDNVVQLERRIDPHAAYPHTSSVIRYVGIYELDEIRNEIREHPGGWIDHMSSFAKQPSERTCVGITLNKDKLDRPGIPSFILQYLIEGPHFERGSFVGYATDIAPARGKFCLFALKEKGRKEFVFVAGYYYPLGERMLSVNTMGDLYKNNDKGFVLRLDKDHSSPDDIVCEPDRFHDWEHDCSVLGVASWSCQWLDHVSMKHHTGLWERLDDVHAGRRIRSMEEPFPDDDPYLS